MSMEPEDKKECTKCHRVLPLSDFHRNHKMPNGRRSQCKECRSEVGSEARKARNHEYWSDPAHRPPRQSPEQFRESRKRAFQTRWGGREEELVAHLAKMRAANQAKRKGMAR